MRYLALITSLAVLFIINSSCEKLHRGEVEPYNKQMFLYGEFVNKPGKDPAITIDPSKSSNEIGIDKNTDATIDTFNNRLNMVFNNIRIQDELGIYEIDKIVTEEFREGEWEKDSENFLTYEKTKRLDLVLVLDVSSSLDQDVVKVKRYAKDFISNLFSEIDSPRIGVVGFSEDVYIQSFTTNSEKAKFFIETLEENKNATRLYEAMDAGYAMIDSARDAEGKYMITFTDGRNNKWSDPQRYRNSDYIYNQLNSSDVNSYTIGLQGKGGVDKDVLKDLAVNDGRYKFPDRAGDVRDVFRKIASSVASTYQLVYDRNQSPITNPIKLRFRLKTHLK